MRRLALPALALLMLGSGAAPEQTTGEPPTTRAAKATLAAGSARFVVTLGSHREAGVIDLEKETAVLDRGHIYGAHSVYQPIPRREADVLGISGMRWVETATRGTYSLVADPFFTGTRSFFKLLARSGSINALGPGEEGGTSVERYSSRLLLEDFLAELPPFERESSKSGDGGWPTSWRDYLDNYYVGQFGGQRVEIAVDPEGRIRLARVALHELVTVELYDYGVHVDASAPPASEVISSSAFDQLKSEYCSNPRRQTLPRPYPCQ